MRKLLILILSVCVLTSFSFFQEEEKSPMNFNGVDAGMTPEEVVKILGKPDDTSGQRGDLNYLYRQAGEHFYLTFYQEKWLSRIYTQYSSFYNYLDLGLPENSDQDYTVTTYPNGAKTWEKHVRSEKYGEFVVKYGSAPGHPHLIKWKDVYVSYPHYLRQ